MLDFVIPGEEAGRATRWASKSPTAAPTSSTCSRTCRSRPGTCSQWADRFGDLGEVIGHVDLAATELYTEWLKPQGLAAAWTVGHTICNEQREPHGRLLGVPARGHAAVHARAVRGGRPAGAAPAPRGRDPPDPAWREERAARARRGDRSAADRPRAARCQAPRRGAEPGRRADPRRERRLPDRPPRPERGRCARERDAPEADRRRDRRARRSGAARRGVRRGEPAFRRSARTR